MLHLSMTHSSFVAITLIAEWEPWWMLDEPHTWGLKHHINTLRSRKNATISQTTFSNAFSLMKMFEFCLRFHWSLSNWQYSLSLIMAWHWPGDKPLSEPMMVGLLKHICITGLHWVKLAGVQHYKAIHKKEIPGELRAKLPGVKCS